MTNSDYDGVFLSNRYINLKLYEAPNQDVLRALKIQESIQESCITRSIAIGLASSVIGLITGSFMYTMTQSSKSVDLNLSTKESFKLSFKEFISQAKSTSKNFAKIGALYTLIECSIQKKRGTCDIYNSLYAGCTTGAALSYKNGPVVAAGGCIAFAAFSAAIEAYQNSTN